MRSEANTVGGLGGWLLARTGAYVLGFGVGAVILSEAIALVVTFGPLVGALVVGFTGGIGIFLPGFVRASCRQTRVAQASWLALAYAPFLGQGAGHPIVPVWLVLAQRFPATIRGAGPGVASVAVIVLGFFAVSYLLLSSLHAVGPHWWHCEHSRRAV